MFTVILKNKKATSTIEYAMLIIIIMSAVLLSQRYILRGFAGRWKAAGDAFGQGKQYDPKKTVECAWSQQANAWYGPDCFDQAWKNSNYQLAYDNCVSTCIDTGDLDSCGGASGCSSYWRFPRPRRWDSNCCSTTCQTTCTDTITRNSVNACKTINNVPCN